MAIDYIGAVAAHGGREPAARALGMAPSTFRRRLREQEAAEGTEAGRGQGGAVYEGTDITPAEAWQEITKGTDRPGWWHKRTFRADEMMDVARLLIQQETRALPRLDLKTPHRPAGQGDEESMVACFSDLQIGHLTSSTNAEVLRERARRYAEKVLTIAKLHRKMYPIRQLYVPFLGDMGQNELIGRFVSLDELEMCVLPQVFGASEIGVEFLSILAPHFDEIIVPCIPGNHGQAHEYAANSSNWDLVTYDRMSLLLRDQPNIRFSLPDRFFQFMNVRGYDFLLVHGDQIRSNGGVPYYGIVNRAMRWQGSLGHFDYLLLGHYHHCATIEWNDFQVMMNGCFVTDDEYVIKGMGFASQAKQRVFGVHEAHGVTWQYTLDLKEEAAA